MTQELPVKTSEDFVAEFETMDLSALKQHNYLVAVSNGDRNASTFVSTTVRGPYSFEEMCEEVGVMWKEEQHHAKVVLCQKERNKGIKTLDENTVDYIEANYGDIITESMLEGVFDGDKEYTCRAGIVEEITETKTPSKQEEKKEVEDEEL